MSSKQIVDLRRRKPGAHLDQAPLPLRPEKRISPVRVRRKRTRRALFSITVAGIACIVLFASYLSYVPRYSVATIDVEGAQHVSPELIRDYAESIVYNGSHNFFSRANIFLYPGSLIAHDIPLEFPRIASASVSRASLFSNAVTITVEERHPVALWCTAEAAACYDVDTTGFIFSSAPVNSGLYVFEGGISTSSKPIGQTFAPGHASGLIAFMQLLARSGVTPEGAYVQQNGEDFIVPLSQGFYIEASFGQDPGQLVNNLQLVLSSATLQGVKQNVEYIDLRFGDKVYYKLNGQSQASTTAQ